MNTRQLNAEIRASERGPRSVGLTFQHELCDLADTMLKTRAIRALESVAALEQIIESGARYATVANIHRACAA